MTHEYRTVHILNPCKVLWSSDRVRPLCYRYGRYCVIHIICGTFCPEKVIFTRNRLKMKFSIMKIFGIRSTCIFCPLSLTASCGLKTLTRLEWMSGIWVSNYLLEYCFEMLGDRWCEDIHPWSIPQNYYPLYFHSFLFLVSLFEAFKG